MGLAAKWTAALQRTAAGASDLGTTGPAEGRATATDQAASLPAPALAAPPARQPLYPLRWPHGPGSKLADLAKLGRGCRAIEATLWRPLGGWQDSLAGVGGIAMLQAVRLDEGGCRTWALIAIQRAGEGAMQTPRGRSIVVRGLVDAGRLDDVCRFLREQPTGHDVVHRTAAQHGLDAALGADHADLVEALLARMDFTGSACVDLVDPWMRRHGRVDATKVARPAMAPAVARIAAALFAHSQTCAATFRTSAAWQDVFIRAGLHHNGALVAGNGLHCVGAFPLPSVAPHRSEAWADLLLLRRLTEAGASIFAVDAQGASLVRRLPTHLLRLAFPYACHLATQPCAVGLQALADRRDEAAARWFAASSEAAACREDIALLADVTHCETTACWALAGLSLARRATLMQARGGSALLMRAEWRLTPDISPWRSLAAPALEACRDQLRRYDWRHVIDHFSPLALWPNLKELVAVRDRCDVSLLDTAAARLEPSSDGTANTDFAAVLAAGAEVDAPDAAGKTLLHRLIERDLPAAAWVVAARYGGALDRADHAGETPFCLALRRNHREWWAHLWQHTSLAAQSAVQPLTLAVADGHGAKLFLLRQGVRARPQDWRASHEAHGAELEVWLDGGLAADFRFGFPPTTHLERAAGAGDLEGVEALLRHGVSARDYDNGGNSALHHLARGLPGGVDATAEPASLRALARSLACAERLLAAGANPYQPNVFGRTFVDLARARHWQEALARVAARGQEGRGADRCV